MHLHYTFQRRQIRGPICKQTDLKFVINSEKLLVFYQSLHLDSWIRALKVNTLRVLEDRQLLSNWRLSLVFSNFSCMFLNPNIFYFNSVYFCKHIAQPSFIHKVRYVSELTLSLKSPASITSFLNNFYMISQFLQLFIFNCFSTH